MESLKAEIAITRKKISIVLHLVNQLSQSRIDPRREIETLEGDVNQSQRLIS